MHERGRSATQALRANRLSCNAPASKHEPRAAIAGPAVCVAVAHLEASTRRAVRVAGGVAGTIHVEACPWIGFGRPAGAGAVPRGPWLPANRFSTHVDLIGPEARLAVDGGGT